MTQQQDKELIEIMSGIGTIMKFILGMLGIIAGAIIGK